MRYSLEDNFVQRDDEASQPLLAFRARSESHDYIAATGMLDNGTVSVPVFPSARLAVEARVRVDLCQSFNEFMMDRRLRQDGLHLPAQGRAHQATGLQEIVETGHLQGRGAMREVMQRIAVPGWALAVVLTYPKPSVERRI
ncbi:MAG: hypothetical protein PVI19_12705, partial [Syntrophobacterales bacterium]